MHNRCVAHSLHSHILQSVYSITVIIRWSALLDYIAITKCVSCSSASLILTDHSVYCLIDISQVFMNIMINCALTIDLSEMMYAMENIDKIMINGHSIDARWNILYCTALYCTVTLLKSIEMKGRQNNDKKIMYQFIVSVHVSIMTMIVHYSFSRYRKIILP